MAFAFALTRYPDRGRAVLEITLDASSYTSGGIVLTPAQMGMLTTPDVCNVQFSTGEGFDATWIRSTNAIKIYKTSTGTTSTEAVAADFTTAMKIRCDILGVPVC